MTLDDSAVKHVLSPLEKLGWQPCFAQQTSVDEVAKTPPIRIVEVHRSGFRCLGDGINVNIPPTSDATVGDWLLFDETRPSTSRVLERKSLFKRRAPGSDRRVQLIAANIETAFIVSSCNQDFNIARLERYIALTFEADVTPVIVLTKADLCETLDPYVDEAGTISDLVSVVTLDARREEPKLKLANWCKPGQTVALLGSSGVGKSTLTNVLSETQSAQTQTIREDDAKGRHTTTHRQLHIAPNGYTVLDTPGIRELQLTDAAEGVSSVFSDLDGLSGKCRFSNCKHETEPGCAVLSALADGTIEAARLARWKKLAAEDRFNSLSLAERRSKDKRFGKMARAIQKSNRK